MSYSDNYDNISKENMAGNVKAAQYPQQQSARPASKTSPTQGMFTPGTTPPAQGMPAPGTIPPFQGVPSPGVMPPLQGTAAPGVTSPYMEQMPTRTSAVPQAPLFDQTPMTVQNQYYLPAYLKNFIGKDIRVEFLIGTTGPLVDRIGTLLEIGASYIVLRPIRTNDLLTCDLYSIKFVTIYAASGSMSSPY